MKILLFGEFSGVHNNLKKGLVAKGHKVVLANDGDGFKKFSNNLSVAPYKGRYIAKIKNISFFYARLKKFVGYDIVQFINPFALPYYYHYLKIPSLVSIFSKKLFYYSCGTDPSYINSKDNFKYFPFDGQYINEKPDYETKFKYKLYSSFVKKIDSIIPCSYSYAIGYFDNPKLSSPILLPGSGEYAAKVKPVNKKIKILFGITRRGFKGADFILEALKQIEKKYPERTEITIVEKLPFQDYLNILLQADILIDQCKSYEYGMNAIFAMEKGLIVLSGAEKEALFFANIKDCPVINITPDADEIVIKIADLLKLSNEDLNSMKKKSLDYVKKYHDPNHIAEQFESRYLSSLNNNSNSKSL